MGSISVFRIPSFRHYHYFQSAGTMRACNAAKFSTTRKKDIIKVNESRELPIEKLEEEGNEESTVEFVSRSSLKRVNSNSEETEEAPEEDPEEETEEQLEEDSETEPEEDPEELVEEDPEEETEEQLEEDPEVEPEEVPEVELSEEPEEESALECVTLSLSSHNDDETEQMFEDPEQEHVTSSVTLKQEHVTSSGKRRRSRWEPQPEQDGETGGGDGSCKRRKTRWDCDDSQLKMLGPIQLPDFRKDFLGSVLDPKVQGLMARLSEINSKLQRSELRDDRLEGERSPSPEPIYNNLGIRINTREVRLRGKLIRERQLIISKLIEKNPTFETPPEYKPPKLFKKLYIPVKEYPTYNFIGLIIGPRGNTQKRMEKETGAKILIRGKGSMKTLHEADPSDNEDLHVRVEASNQKSLDAAVSMVEKLLIPRQEGINDHKRAQLQELAKLKGTNKDKNLCRVCGEQGHKHYACPQQQSTLKAISCDTCGSSCHPTSSCPLTATPQVSNPLSHSSGLHFGLTPNTKITSKKEISDASLYVGYLPQAVDDNRLREFFSPFGKITEAKVIKDRSTSLSKGYGFVKFHNANDAAVAVMHMNGYQMDGKMLAVRVAGLPPVTGSSAFSQAGSSGLYPRPAVVSPSVPSQAAWLCPPESMLPQAPVSFLNSDGLGLPYSGHANHLPKFGATDFPPLYVVSSLDESKNAFLSPGLLAQFPGDPDYPGSKFESYFATPSSEPSPSFYSI